ncbi:MAG: NAD(P)/FAD-dependent oxidoreductase [Calditrichaeota bacterium]|nr:NAD(P)/FAD-dependent oxidoreductase [Calditrichota bacterium]MBT7619140.1 NAD(P)/FAD-dependent oxidoreductase [Calditrichota bacterium]MBT7789103.1 NAD(P)/FAD-dependent oxidoreductase [Calditrichota bacterium]
MMNRDYDVIVVGGGPAGAMAAHIAAEDGAKTLLLERDSHIGLPVRCGEGVSIGNIRQLVEVDDRLIAHEMNSAVIYAPDDTAVEIPLASSAVVLERALFDRYLAELAASSGADIQTRSDVTGLTENNGCINGITYNRFGREMSLKCGVVIGADGVESRVGKWAGLKTKIKSFDMESAYQMVLSGIDINHRNFHFYVGNEIAPGGYIWVFPKGETTANVGIGVKSSMCSPGDAYKKLIEFIEKHFGKPVVVGESAGGVPCGPPLKEPLTDGLILVGDAARHCNPLSGGGICSGMISGKEAGSVAAMAVSKGDVSKRCLGAFNKRIEKKIVRSHKRAYRLSLAVNKLDDSVFLKTAHEMIKIPVEDRNLRNVFLKALISSPSLVVDIVKMFV